MELLLSKMDEYFAWLKQKYKYKQLDSSIEITTPFKNHINDYIRIYADEIEDNIILLSDDGQTLNELSMMGIDTNSKTRMKIIKDTLNQFNLKLNNDEIITEVDSSFAQSKHNLVQGILKIYDLTLTTKANSTSIFYEEVFEFLFEHDIGGTDKVKVSGASGINYTIDYIIPPRKDKPEAMINFANKLDFNKITTDSFAYRDLIHNRPNRNNLEPKMFIVANDELNKIPEKVYQAASHENIIILKWSNKPDILEQINNR
ncbi:DUF1828 domain-containing protein [Macrococcoides caseolyticum]|uniref:DUF1828 domain-containing protein n=1 Tax=Macrococcoides caseolyticum TaxID=69966 RepID=UPI000C338F1F|nr:DUF1828 domain-containing protein [Macrococcus caseolyticus]PKE22733.1 hypothetical protein CW688_00980 [Macrococcus caseolyticus]